MRHFILTVTLFVTQIIVAQNYNYLGTYTSDGTPNYLMNPSDVVSEETMDMIKTALPESYPVPDYNPHYISSGYDTDIHLVDNAEVYVTFVSEGAGYKNILGFYTYPTDNPSLTTPTKDDITIIFPNVSALHSGGSLLAGDKVSIGEFEAGTSIGWVLLANGWKGSVTDGLWQLYSNIDYNPESDEELRKHNVLIADKENEMIILGFEDIRRDRASCDNDFNDAVFYVTANPFEAIASENITKVEEVTDVTSANNGGLESNGTLAEKIAKRNFKRSVLHQNADKQYLQPKMNKLKSLNRLNNKGLLEQFIPSTGMFGDEESHVSSPNDLVDITNAEEVFSVDYYKDNHRIAAVLASYTPEHVYDHTKAICDRLNYSSLEDVRLVTVRGHQIIHSKILRESGEIENTLSFSIKANTNEYQLHSYWGIDQYPEGNYYNFQVWGATNTQVFAIANKIIDKFNEAKNITSDKNSEKIPQVFVKSGYYQNGVIHLDLINNTKSTKINLTTNYKKTEHSNTETLTKSLTLSGARLETIEVETGRLFDAGISIKGESSEQIDALYLADGPWGVDYLEESANVEIYDIEQNKSNSEYSGFVVERNLLVKGDILKTFNAFRQILPGNQTFNVEEYNTIEFSSNSSHEIELILMQKGLEDWNDRFFYKIPTSQSKKMNSILISDFKNLKGEKANINNVERIVFSLNGDGKSYEPFELSIDEIRFTNKPFTNTNSTTFDIVNKVNPNPFKSKTHISVNATMKTPIVKVFNTLGKMVDKQKITVENSKIEYTNSVLPVGVYIYTIEEGNESQIGKFIIY